MNGRIVNCVPESKAFLTLETEGESGRITAVLANLDGTPLQDNGLKYAGSHPDHVEVYLDNITGEHFAKVKASLVPQLEKGDVDVYQGVGGVSGWFVKAPDFTINGRHGGGAEADSEVVIPEAEAANVVVKPPTKRTPRKKK